VTTTEILAKSFDQLGHSATALAAESDKALAPLNALRTPDPDTIPQDNSDFPMRLSIAIHRLAYLGLLIR
jgi:hypothetical protein